MPDLTWLKDIEFTGLLAKDMKLVHDSCGMDVLLSLLENLPSLNLYISPKPLIGAKERYIRKYFTGGNVKELAVRLQASERFVYDIIERSRKVQKGA